MMFNKLYQNLLLSFFLFALAAHSAILPWQSHDTTANNSGPRFGVSDSYLNDEKVHSIDSSFLPQRNEPLVYLANRKVHVQRTAFASEKAKITTANQPTKKDTYVCVIQFTVPLTETLRKDILNQGIRIIGYIPDNAWLVELTKERIATLETDANVRGIIAYMPRDKYNAAIETYIETEPRTAGQSVLPHVTLPTTPRTLTALQNMRGEQSTFSVDRALPNLSEAPSPELREQYERAATEGKDIDTIALEQKHVVVSIISPDYIEDVRAIVEENAGEITHVIQRREQARIHAKAYPQTCRVLAENAAVQFIEPAEYQYYTMNDIATSSAFINAQTAWNTYGLTGRGQIIGHCDSGIDRGYEPYLHPDFTNRIRAAYSLRSDGLWDDPDGHGTHTAGTLLGNGSASGGQFKGVAYEAEIVHQSAYADVGVLTLPANLYDLFTTPYADGARVHSDSWGSSQYAGQYAEGARDVDTFMWDNPEMLIVFSSGNDGEDGNANGVCDINGRIGVPGTAKNVLTVGAAESSRTPGTGGLTDEMWSIGTWQVRFPVFPIHDDYISLSFDGFHKGIAAISSRGPCDDGRIKPDVVAPGTDIISCRSRVGQLDLWGRYNAYYNFSGGSSMATPLVAGSAALLRQHLCESTVHTNPSAALVKALLIGGARSLSPGQYGYGGYREVPANTPNNVEGWGMIDVGNSLQYASLVDKETLTTGDEKQYSHFHGENDILSIILVWTDKPGIAGAGKALVNDVDVFLIAPDGTTNYANNGSAPDRINTVETITINGGLTGTYDVVVSGYSIDPPDVQPFALVVMSSPGVPPVQAIQTVKRTPQTVKPTTPVFVTADIATNDSGLASASLYYRVDSGTWARVTMAELYGIDVGVTVTGGIPIFAENTFVDYFIAATAGDAVITYSPTNSYTVIDAFVCVWQGATPTPPYKTWGTGFTTIQDALDYVSDGWRIDVTGGLYDVSAYSDGLLVDKAVHIRAVEGPSYTAIDARYYTRPLTVIARDSVVEGFTLWGGYITTAMGGASGGGVYMLDGTIRNCNVRDNIVSALSTRGGGVNCQYNAVVDACRVFNNYSGGGWAGYGGGILCDYGGVVRSSVIYANSAQTSGGGVYLYKGGAITNSTIAGNAAPSAAGLRVTDGDNTPIHNSILYNNNGDDFHELRSTATVTYTVLPYTREGEGNTNCPPGFANPDSYDYHLSDTAFALNSGTNAGWMLSAFDPNGNARVLEGIVDRGGYERGSLHCSFEGTPRRGWTPLTVTFAAHPSGTNTANIYYKWDLDCDGIWDEQGWNVDSVQYTYSEGKYDVYMEAESDGGEKATWYATDYIKAYNSYTQHVSHDGNHTWPYTSWETAATNTFDAYDAMYDGHTLLFTNGVYSLETSLYILKNITVVSVMGAEYTILQQHDGGGINLACSKGGADISGLTLRNGNSMYSGGAYLTAGTIHDCNFTQNNGLEGGGANLIGNAKIYSCRFYHNAGATYGTAFQLRDNALAERCIINNNNGYVGTVSLRYGGTVRNSLFYNNDVGNGGGVFFLSQTGEAGTVENCTLYGNNASSSGGGVYFAGQGPATLRNSIIYNNTAGNGANYIINGSNYFINHICTTPALPGNGNISDNPQLVMPSSGKFMLSSNSPACNSGTNMSWMVSDTDLAGRERINNGTVDMGAYEYYAQPIMWVENAELHFPDTFVFTTNTRSFTVHNLGDITLTANISELTAPFSSAATSAVVTAHSSIEFPLEFVPDDTIYYSDSIACEAVDTEDTTSVTMDGMGISWLSANPSLNFGDVPLDTTVSSMIRIENDGPEALTGTVINIFSPFSVSNGVPYSIESGGRAYITFAFTPTAEQPYEQTVFCTGGGGVEIVLRGTGVPEPVSGLLLLGFAVVIVRKCNGCSILILYTIELHVR